MKVSVVLSLLALVVAASCMSAGAYVHSELAELEEARVLALQDDGETVFIKSTDEEAE